MTDWDVLTAIDELVDKITHREPYTIHAVNRTQHHVTTHPSLIDQLAAAITPTNNLDQDGYRPAATSKPTARIEAIDALARIDREASRWLRDLGHDDPGDTAACVRALAPYALGDRDLTHDIRRWWTWARILTGWDSPAWRPDNTCPLCGERGTLRVRIAEQIAVCVADKCHETWVPETISFLAEHIRTENRDTADQPAC